MISPTQRSSLPLRNQLIKGDGSYFIYFALLVLIAGVISTLQTYYLFSEKDSEVGHISKVLTKRLETFDRKHATVESNGSNLRIEILKTPKSWKPISECTPDLQNGEFSIRFLH
jgi:hypothetical protein